MYKTLTVVLFAALALLFAAGSAQAANGRIGVVDVQAVLAKSDAGKDAMAQMQDFKQKQRAALKDQSKSLKEERAAIGKNASIQTEAAQKQAMQEFQKHFQAFQQDARKRSQALMKKRAELLRPLKAKLYDVIRNYATAHGYDLILDKVVAIYSEKSMDLTDAVLKAFNTTMAKGS